MNTMLTQIIWLEAIVEPSTGPRLRIHLMCGIWTDLVRHLSERGELMCRKSLMYQ